MTDTIKSLIDELTQFHFHYAPKSEIFFDNVNRYAEIKPAITALHEENRELREVLLELCDLMDGVMNGDYKPDSFTLQPARAVLAKYGRE